MLFKKIDIKIYAVINIRSTQSSKYFKKRDNLKQI